MDLEEYENVTTVTTVTGDTAPAPSSTVYPASWRNDASHNPKDEMMNLKGRDYLTAQSRLTWFINDQRYLIMSGRARLPYVVRTEEVALDLERRFAEFKTYVRDVLGNECTMYGSETASDFTDYIEKASTKSLSRALAGLGYSTKGAQDFEEGEGNLADAPQERRQSPSRQHGYSQHGQHGQHMAQPRTTAPTQPQATQAQPTSQPVRAAVHADALRGASQAEQAQLHRTLKQYFSDRGAVERFLEGALTERPRHIDATGLPSGETDLTAGEIASILALLQSYPKRETPPTPAGREVEA